MSEAAPESPAPLSVAEQDATSHETAADIEASLPTSAAEWKALFAAVPARTLLQFIQKERLRAARILSGFRPAPEAVRNPLIVSRLTEEAMKNNAFAQEACSLRPSPMAASASEAAPVHTPTPEKTAPSPKEDPRLREQVNKQRAALKEKEALIARLEEQVTQITRERDVARQETVAAQEQAHTAVAEADRQKRQREREARKATTAAAVTTKPAEPHASSPAPASPAVVTQRVVTLVFEGALQRLLSRGKYAVVAEVCREAMLAGNVREAPAAARGAVHALYAAALYGMAEAERAAEQDQQGATAFLDAGDAAQATECFVRLLAHDSLLRSAMTGEDTALLKRLVLLAAKTGQEEAVRTGLARLRIVAPGGFALLQRALRRAGKKFADFAESLSPDHSAPIIGADEVIALPIPPGSAIPPSVTPRRLAESVEAGDLRYVLRVRDALAELRRTGGPSGATVADALLTAVAELSPAAVFPYTLAPGQMPRAAIVDASNVARHDPDPLAFSPPPRVANLLQMRNFLLKRGFFPVLLIADATLRYHVDDKAGYQNLIDRGVIRETPPGTSADESLIAEARERDAPLITNDRLSDWGDAARRIERLGFSVQPGGVSLTPF